MGYIIGGGVALLAFFPKLPALLVTIPSPVMAAYLLLAIGLLFVEGIRTVIKDGLDFQKVVVVGVTVSLGAGIDNQTIFADIIGGAWGRLLDNGILFGALAAMLMTQFLELTSRRRSCQLQATLDTAALPRIDEFVTGLAERLDWNEAATHRLRSAAEETLLSLAAAEGNAGGGEPARLIVVAHPEPAAIELEFMAVFDEENLEDRLAYLNEEEEGWKAGRETPSPCACCATMPRRCITRNTTGWTLLLLR